MTTAQPEEKPTLMQLRRTFNAASGRMITSTQLAKAAIVPLADEFQMELGRPVSKEVAERVIHAFSVAAGHYYTLADITVTLKDGAA